MKFGSAILVFAGAFVGKQSGMDLVQAPDQKSRTFLERPCVPFGCAVGASRLLQHDDGPIVSGSELLSHEAGHVEQVWVNGAITG